MTLYRESAHFTQNSLKIYQKSSVDVFACYTVNNKQFFIKFEILFFNECIFQELFTELKNIEPFLRISSSNFVIFLCQNQISTPIKSTFLDVSLILLQSTVALPMKIFTYQR